MKTFGMSHDAVTCGFAEQQSASHDPSSTEMINFGHLSPFMEGTGWTGDLVATWPRPAITGKE
jgi:hypothetical protein